MNAHFFRTIGYPEEQYNDVSDLINSFSGIMRYIFHAEVADAGKGILSEQDPMLQKKPDEDFFCAHNSFEEIFKKEESLSWEQIFTCTKDLREKYDIGDDEYVFLLTEKNNIPNWFSALNPTGKKDVFIQTSYWDFFAGSDQRYPVVYQIVTQILKLNIFQNINELNNNWHYSPKGCIMDICQEKKDIQLKLRTGDVCDACVQLISEKKVNTLLVEHVFHVIDTIRTQMSFKQRYLVNRKIPHLHVRGYNKKLIFPSLGNLEIRLNPLEKCLYVFFLKHPEGVALNYLQDYRTELYSLYENLSTSGEIEQIKSSINDLINPLSNSVSEKISRIKKKFKDGLGENMSLPYLISGNSGEKRFIPAASTKNELVFFED